MRNQSSKGTNVAPHAGCRRSHGGVTAPRIAPLSLFVWMSVVLSMDLRDLGSFRKDHPSIGRDDLGFLVMSVHVGSL